MVDGCGRTRHIIGVCLLKLGRLYRSRPGKTFVFTGAQEHENPSKEAMMLLSYSTQPRWEPGDGKA
jgi:hypothetical protein